MTLIIFIIKQYIFEFSNLRCCEVREIRCVCVCAREYACYVCLPEGECVYVWENVYMIGCIADIGCLRACGVSVTASVLARVQRVAPDY